MTPAFTSRPVRACRFIPGINSVRAWAALLGLRLAGAGAGAVGAVGGMAGCWSTTARDQAIAPGLDGGGGPVVAPEDWPARSSERLAGVVEGTPKAFNPFASRILVDGRPPFKPEFDPFGYYSIPHVGVHGMGVLRVITARGITIQVDESETPGGPPRVSVQPAATDELFRFVSFSTLPNRPVTSVDLVAGGSGPVVGALRALRRDLSNMAIPDADIAGPRMLTEGIAAYIATPPAGTPVRGMIVHLGGTGSSRFEAPLVGRLAKAGWNVLSMPFVGVTGGYTTSFVMKHKGQLPEEATVVMPSPSTAPYRDPITSPGLSLNFAGVIETFSTPEQLGERLAAITDDRVAEPAYMIEAVLEYLAQERPDIVRAPLALLGCSAGALVAPAVAARLPGRFDAAVLVGGGCNLLDIGLRTALSDARPPIVWDRQEDEEDQQARAVAAYARATRLDPLHTARALRGTPTLMLHATYDRIIPAERGLELWDLLGRPERRNLLGGHEGLFLTLADQDDVIDGWLSRTLNVPAAAK